MQVRRGQHDAQQFWLALLSAVRQAATTGRVERPAATPDFNGRVMVDRVLSELADDGGRLSLVIDDVHEPTSAEALAQLTRLLTNLPRDVHAVLATRRDLRLRLHQLRPAGELAGHAKLQARDRSSAVQRARELRLLSAGLTR
jgi:LuxR family transcriptional regulator, maltose regulon positive regulatory protein